MSTGVWPGSMYSKRYALMRRAGCVGNVGADVGELVGAIATVSVGAAVGGSVGCDDGVAV